MKVVKCDRCGIEGANHETMVPVADLSKSYFTYGFFGQDLCQSCFERLANILARFFENKA